MQLADGELDHLDNLDATGDAKIAGVRHLGELVRGTSELAADAVPEAKFAGMWREIDKLLDNEAAAKEKIESAERPVTVAPPASEKRGWLSRVYDRYKGHFIVGVVSAGAVAGVALVMNHGTSDPDTMNGGGPIDVRPVSQRAPVDVESLDTPDGQGTVLNLEDEDGHTTVIWVSPADTVEGI
jgi:hypothetical protein